MATITVSTPGADGTTTVQHVAATAGGDTLATQGRSVGLLVRNTGAADREVTLAGVDECSQGQVHDEPYLAPAGVEMVLPVPLHCMNEDTGDVAVSYDDATGLEVAAVRLPSVGLSPTVVRNGLMVWNNGTSLTLFAVRPGVMVNNGSTIALTSLSGAVPHADGTISLATV